MWNCARAPNILVFNKAMAIKELNPDAHAWLGKIKQKHWARAYFSGRDVTDSLLNNVCESFDAKILDARDKTIITCLEWIREYAMVRLVVVEKDIVKCKGSLTPIAREKLDANKKVAAKLKWVFNGDDKYQVPGQCMD